MTTTSVVHETDEARFLHEVRAFLDEALTPELRAVGRATIGVHSDIAAGLEWHRRLYRKGWIAPAWPKAWGGTGWTARQRFLFERECALNDAPILFAGGIRSIGPLLIEMGTTRQRERYIPGILSGDDLWCQGFSEPGAGSDLVAVNTRAVRDGDYYVVTGSKIWTTGAHLSNRMFAIVRTSEGERPAQGLTFLLVEMPSPGLAVAPIIGLAGEHEFNQVFFDGVRVPIANRVGEEDAEFFAKQFAPVFEALDFVNLEFRNAYVKILSQGVPQKPFDMVTPDLPAPNHAQVDDLIQLSSLTYGRDRATVENMIRERYLSH